ncbi:MAG: NAD(P)H-hydrate dehydratase [Gammaproteobacteria bacterium]|nr:NAD(P)H-hydrate dehydratase [Gammaproteobacteria bacterium]
MNTSSTSLYTPESVRRIDHNAIQVHGIAGNSLMRKAGKAVLDVLLKNYPRAKTILVLCGSGNNAGDGYVIARLAQQHGLMVSVVSLVNPDALQGDARQAYEHWRETAELSANDESLVSNADVIIDALLGTGLQRNVEAKWKRWIDLVNDSDKPVIAVDVPSGLDALTGTIKGAAINANITVTFIALKAGLFTASGKACCGEIVFDALSLPDVIYEGETPVAELLLDGHQLPERRHDSHKGMYGHVLVIGGNQGMPGAVILAARAALRSGAGRVSVVTQPGHIAAVAVACPEAMVHGSVNGELAVALAENVSVVVIGPGLGRDAWAHRLLMQVVTLDLPIVLDADALNIIAEKNIQIKGPHIMTPHPGEAARLLSTDTAAVQADRFDAIRRLHNLQKGAMVLKGSGTLVFDGQQLGVCPYGNPAMAVAGMGDVLSGVIAALVAQGMALNQAASAGVCVHARAGDLAAGSDVRGVLATEVIEKIRAVINEGQ